MDSKSEKENRSPLFCKLPRDPRQDELLCQIEARAQDSLNKRLAQDNYYNEKEIEAVARLSTAVFPQDFCVDEKTSGQFRTLSSLSKLELQPAQNITSHRRFIGPIIVALKRLSWPLIHVHLKDSFARLEELTSSLIYSLSRQTVEIEKLRRCLERQEKGEKN